MPQPLSAEAATARAIKRNPARMTKLARGQRPARFQAFTVSQLLETYQDPRAVLLSIASMDTAALAKLCQCSMMDAIAERRLCAQAVIPYVAQKLPVQLDVRTAKTINLNLLSPVEFAEVEKLANTDEASDSDGSFSLQLITTAEPAHEQTTAQPAQGQSVESGDHGTPVTPAVAADVPQGPAGGYLRPLAEFFDGPSRARRQRIEDAPPARDERDSWQRTHEGGTWPPDRK